MTTPTLIPPKRTAMSAQKRREAITAYLFLLPTIIGFMLFVLGPMLGAIGLSFFDWNLLSTPEFSGTANYQALLHDIRLGTIFLSTLKIAFSTVFLNVLLGLCFAVLLEQKMPNLFRQFFRLSYFFPFVVSVSAVALIWTFLMNKDLGIINYYLGLIGIERIGWLSSSRWAPVSVVIIAVWKSLGFNVLVFLGGLQTIPKDLYDAAEVDGAGGWSQFRHITLPLLSPTTFFLIVINLINAFQIFAEPYILTQGGPGDASRPIVMYIYEQGFRFFNLGYASTVALVLFVIILLLTLLQFKLSERWTFYQ
ncbi:MAG: sugar ABC transporter permease [Anaerolineae bacterium]|nr:sugar ABC transporter permease [Anaerolineae bacterium]